MDAEGSSVGSGGCMVDIVRRFWPNRKGMYTCTYLLTSRLIYVWTHFYRLEYENIGTRIQLWHPYRLYPHHTEPNTLDCCCRHSTRDHW
jgi:hypothetical protein